MSTQGHLAEWRAAPDRLGVTQRRGGAPSSMGRAPRDTQQGGGGTQGHAEGHGDTQEVLGRALSSTQSTHWGRGGHPAAWGGHP